MSTQKILLGGLVGVFVVVVLGALGFFIFRIPEVTISAESEYTFATNR